jgi:hypothetical protein
LRIAAGSRLLRRDLGFVMTPIPGTPVLSLRRGARATLFAALHKSAAVGTRAIVPPMFIVDAGPIEAAHAVAPGGKAAR